MVDVSHYIVNNNFEGDAAAWVTTFGGYTSVPQSNGAREAWSNDNSTRWFLSYQDIVVPAGVYRLTANAYHRGYHTEITNIVLFGSTAQKEYTVGVKPLSSETAAYGSSPNSMAAAKTAFDAGFWLNTLNNIVVEDEGEGMGTLRVGIKNVAQPIRATTATSGDIWTIWSNFKLYQISGAELDTKRDNVVAEATALLAEPTDYSDGGVLSASIATLSGIADEDLTIAAIKTLQADMLTYRNARMASASSAKPADVTHLIKNASFESGHVSKTGTANGHYNEPIGWSLMYDAGNVHTNNNVTVIKNNVVPAGVAAGVVIQPTHGERSLVARFRWTTNQSFTLTQSVNNLSGGKYRISADLGKLSTAGTAQLNVHVAGNSVMAQNATFVAGPAFTNVSSVFDALEGDNMVITIYMTQTGGSNEATIIVDNIKLEYLGVEPFVSVSESTLAFTPSTTEKILNVRAGNITDDIVLTPSANFTLSTTTIAAADAMTPSGVNVTVTCNAGVNISDGALTVASGSLQEVVALTMTETPIAVSHAGIFLDQSFAVPVNITVSGDLFNDITLAGPNGISFSQGTVSTAEALAGKEITVYWDPTVSINDKNIELFSGDKTAAVTVYAVANNLVSSWDGDNAEGEGSRLTDFGWTVNNAAGDVATGTATFNVYNATSGIRYVPLTSSLVYTYKGKAWTGSRIAYLRSWAADASNTFNLPVVLQAGIEYVFRGVAAWHNNETEPSFTLSVRDGKASTANVLGTQTQNFTVRQAGADYKFSFTPETSGTYYVTVSSSAPNDAMCSPMYLSVVDGSDFSTSVEQTASGNSFNVYPTVTDGIVNVRLTNGGSIRVFDIAGRMVVSNTAARSFEQVQLPTTGVFFIEINDGKETNTVKVLRVR